MGCPLPLLVLEVPWGFFFFTLLCKSFRYVDLFGNMTFFKLCSSLNVVKIKRWLNNKIHSSLFIYCAEISLNVSHMCRWDQLYLILFVILNSVIYYFSIQRVIEEVEPYLVQLLQNFINEAKYTSKEGVDIILSYILKENKEKYPAMYKVAVLVLRNCSTRMNFPIKKVCRVMSVVYPIVFQS